MFLLAAVLVAAAALGGCGSDDDSDATTSAATTDSSSSSGSGSAAGSTTTDAQADGGNGAPPGASASKVAFLAQANKACKQASKNLFTEANSYFEKNLSKGLPEQVLVANTLKATVAPVTEAEIAAIKKLDPPPGEEEQVEAIVAAQEAGLDQLNELKKATDFGTAEKVLSEASKMAKAYGLTDCTAAL
jgi:hypothetical protein